MSTLINNLGAVLKKYTLQELSDIAIQEFPETTWDEIRNRIVQRKEGLTKTNIIKLLLDDLKENYITSDEIENRISKLLLLAVGKSSKRNWTTFQLVTKTENWKNKDILENIKSCVRRTGMLANIHLLKYNHKNVLSIEKKIIVKNSGIKKQLPIFFQFFLNEPYLFCTRKVIEKKIMTAVVESLGFSDWKLSHLTGPNVSDLLTILKNKKCHATMAPFLFSEPELDPQIKVTETIAEFGQMEERRNYGEKIFGENPPQLQSLSVSLKDCKWQQLDDNFDKMNDTPLDGTTLTFHASNIAELFKEMIKEGVVDKPIPEYMKAILHAGKNEFKITQTK